jgi:hypothetical protein
MWVAFEAGIPEITREYSAKVDGEYEGITAYWHDGVISVIKERDGQYWIFETSFTEELEIDVTELRAGDVIWGCVEDGPVKAHEPFQSYPETEELVTFLWGTIERFGKPQQLPVLRGGQFPAL